MADPAEMNFDAGHPYNEKYNPDWYVKGKGRGATTGVREFAPNALVLYDMSGNVWEWCWDWYRSDYYSQGNDKNPLGPDGGEEKICRGGSYFVFEYGCRAGFRSMLAPEYSGRDICFRVVRRAD